MLFVYPINILFNWNNHNFIYSSDCDGKQCADECQNGSTVGACNQDGKCITDGSSLNCGR